jgi:hypothetical protein
MNIASELVKAFNDGYAQGKAAAEAELRQCRNELCFLCGNYKNAHKGACDGCRWGDKG